MSDGRPVIVWFRQDLRIADNPALGRAVASGRPVLPVFVLDDENAGVWRAGAASRWWLHHSLTGLDRSLGGNLAVYAGKADDVLPALAARTGAAAVYWNRCYEPWRIRRDRVLKAALLEAGCDARSSNGGLLYDPARVAKADGTPYRVFTPFYRKGCLAGSGEPRLPTPAPALERLVRAPDGLGVNALGLVPSIPWYAEMESAWQPGEAGAHARLDAFLATGLDGYREGRNFPDRPHVSRLSPHLHFGEISPRQVWHAARGAAAAARLDADADHFQSELGWREFSHYLLFHFPSLPERNLQPKFDRFPWRDDPEALASWQQGRTGYPIVDAGMRELWRTGYLHNRVRMIVGSFLVKNLLLHWRHGEAWFWDTLLDADLANNSAGWQWIAGSGADAAPYFRIFNPLTQGTKFDPQGRYVRRYVPEIAALPDRYLHSPWTAPTDVLDAAGLELGRDYPLPIVDLAASRERALAAFRSLN